MKTVHLRPHHLLCIQKYTGHGYDEAFTAHMTALTASLAAKPRTPVRLTRGCDDLCAACPHQAGGVCTSLEKVAEMDGGVLAACGLAYGQCLPWSEAARLARERVFETERFAAICAQCQWYSLCERTEISRENRENSL